MTPLGLNGETFLVVVADAEIILQHIEQQSGSVVKKHLTTLGLFSNMEN
jgi:hypothetical protein